MYKVGDGAAAAGEIHLSGSDKLQSSIEQIATIDVPLQNGGTKNQEENDESGKFI